MINITLVPVIIYYRWRGGGVRGFWLSDDKINQIAPPPHPQLRLCKILTIPTR